MSDEKLQEGVALYKSGNKVQAAKVLGELVQQEPNNATAWYGLALSVDDVSKKIYCLKKVLAIDPSNQKARQLLERLDTQSQGNEFSNEPFAPATNPQKELKQLNKVGVIAIISVALLLCAGVAAFLFFNFGLAAKTESPEQKYSKEMEPVFAKLDKWFNGPVADWDKVLNSPAAKGEDTTNSTLFTLYTGLKGSNIIGKDEEERERKLLVANLVPTAESIVNDGYDIQVSLGGITPPDSIRIAHQQIYDCVKYEVDRSNAMIKFLTENNTTLADKLDESSCTLMSNALEKIKTFVQDNQ